CWGTSNFYGQVTVPAGIAGVTRISSGSDGNAVIGQAPAPPCLGDLDASRDVNGIDLGLLLADWGRMDGPSTDIDGDQLVDGRDLGLMLATWGPCLN
ncbi:MAG: hypothetical protein ACKOHI_00950, partial [Phycisphaerales bacterium]